MRVARQVYLLRARSLRDVPVLAILVISIVVPTYARPGRLQSCLSAIARLDTCGIDFEVVVVDDGGPHDLTAVLADFDEKLPLRLITQSRAGPGGARNAGAAVARGEYLAFLDDDCQPDRGWLKAFVQALQRDAGSLYGGSVQNVLVENPYSEASEWINNFVYDYNRGSGAREPFFTTNNIALSTDRFRAIGGFTTAIPSATAEDKEFCSRWRGHGFGLAHLPDAVVHHSHQLTFAQFWRQHFNYGRGSLTVGLMRRRRGQHGILPEGAGFYGRLVLSPIQRRAPRPWRLAALLVVSQLATLAGGLRESLWWMTGRE
jgi:glycosyltransferase involved in cell wall biosynthesis